MGKFGEKKFGKVTLFEHLAKKFGDLIDQPKWLLIVSSNLDDFSLANHGQFAKFTKLSLPNFPLYGIMQLYIVVELS